MKITGGKLRGRRLHVPKAGVRPTTGRVREAIFSMLGEIDGAKVLDLFCGSGALGIEALSRGAADVTFVNKKTAAVIRNIDGLGIGDLESRWGWRVIQSDVFDYFRGEVLLADPTFDVVFCDPPYTLAAALGTGLDLFIPGVCAKGGRIVLETLTENPLALSLPALKQREYGDTLIRIYSNE